jgi:hypothetical protein
VGPILTQDAGVDQVNAAALLELGKEMDAQTMFVGLAGGIVVQPVGAVPTFVAKSHEPPVGVDGAVAASLKTNHSKYVPPEVYEFPYKPLVAIYFPYLKL